MKYECKKIDYCPCTDCDERWTKEPDYSFGRLAAKMGFMKIKNGIEWQYKERIKNLPQDIRMEFFKLMTEGKNLGQAREAVNIGLGVAGQLILDQIEVYEVYSFKNPYTNKISHDSLKKI